MGKSNFGAAAGEAYCSCSKGSIEDKILVPKLPENYARCAKCGHPVNGPYCQGCALLREKLEEGYPFNSILIPPFLILMTSFGYRLNPRYAIKECLSCGALYTEDFCCSKGSVEDKTLVPKPPKNCARCAKCGHPVNGPYCQGCALLREKLEEGLVSCLKYFHDTSESSNDSTNVVNAPRDPFVVKQEHGVKSSQNPPPIDECCCECGNALDGIFCQQCICKSCGKGAHIGYNCPLKVSIISNPEPCNQTINNEPPQTLPSFDPTCYSKKENSVPCVSKPYFVDEPSNIFNPPP
nr:hypothetical protein [Tanacetum cinerariifolium]